MSKFKIFETDQFREEMKANFRGQGSRIREKLTAYVYSYWMLGMPVANEDERAMGPSRM